MVSARAPRLRDGFEVDVGLAEIERADRAERGQARIEGAADHAEFRIARIAEGEHAVAQLGQFRGALAAEEFEEAARVVGWITIALGADDDQQQAFLRELAQWIRAGAAEAHREAGTLRVARELFGRAAGVAGLAAVDDGQVFLREWFTQRLRRRSRLRRGIAGECGGVAGQPPQRAGVEAVEQAQRLGGLVLG